MSQLNHTTPEPESSNTLPIATIATHLTSMATETVLNLEEGAAAVARSDTTIQSAPNDPTELSYDKNRDILHTIPAPRSNEYKIFWQQFRRACTEGDKNYLDKLPPGWIERIEEHTLLDTLYSTVLYRHLDIFDMLVKIPKIRDNINFPRTIKAAIQTMLAYAKTGIPEKLLAQFSKEIDLETEVNLAFLASAKMNDLSLMRFLLHSPDLDKKANLAFYGKNALIAACEQHHFEIIKYLTSHGDLSKPVCVLEEAGNILFTLCIYEHTDSDIAHYLFNSPDMPHNMPASAIDESVVGMVLRNEDWVMLEYFIIAHDIECRPELQALLNGTFSVLHYEKIQDILEIKKTKKALEKFIHVLPKNSEKEKNSKDSGEDKIGVSKI